ncbi:MAG: thioredoxin domain-containing protein [Saprospiraceae bacterium]
MAKYILFFLIVVNFSCNTKTAKMSTSNHEYTNALIHESSPYLLQHAHNPVNWHPWNAETLAKAKKEDKMLIISIGYAACHWCHVMEHESFEDTLVAKLMNDNYICIKIDREERPDIDDVYMTACQMSSGRGCGWPLNAFALPDGRPVWAGTYFPKGQWVDILNHFKKMKQDDMPKLLDSAEKITNGIKSAESMQVVANTNNFKLSDLDIISDRFLAGIDMDEGGKIGAPKFPMPNNYEYLLHHYKLTGNKKLLNAALLTLDKMAMGGIYDQLGGGFARYSTDGKWLAPHFEKMLYDNGQLVSLYAHAYQITKKQLYKDVIIQTTAFIERELMNENYGFYSSLDADSEGEEGKFYVWSTEEIDSIIGDKQQAAVFKDYYSMKKNGNWEHTNILMVNKDFDPKNHSINGDEVEKIINAASTKLMSYRSTRIRPGLDDKILTSWNGLMLKGYIEGYKALGDHHYLDIALNNANFIASTAIQKDGSLNRNYKNGKSTINAFLDDYATIIDAFISLYEVTFDIQWLEKAKLLTQHVDNHFENKSSKMYNYTSDLDPALIARKMELSDNVIPASNSMMARNLHKLGTIYYDNKMLEKSSQMLNNMWVQISQTNQPSYYSNWCQLYASMTMPPYEIAVLGDKATHKANEMQKEYLPNAFFLGGQSEGDLQLLEDKLQEGRTMIYVCQNKVCKLPIDDATIALSLIK